jgi:carbonic anhydrase
MVEKLLRGNKKFREEIFGPEHLERFAKGQHPDTLWIGCSDSRVPETLLTGSGDGELFVHRNVGNLVPEHQSETGAALEYAVEHLRVKEIVICGHYGCGGLTALLRGVDHRTHIGHWLRNAEKALHHLQAGRPGFADLPEEEALKLLVEENLRVQRMHAISYPFVRDAVKNHGLHLHILIYDLATGVLRELKE